MIALRLIPSPRIHEPLVSYDDLRWVGYDVANRLVEVPCLGRNEVQAQQAAAIALGVPAWRVRVRRAPPTLTGNGVA